MGQIPHIDKTKKPYHQTGPRTGVNNYTDLTCENSSLNVYSLAGKSTEITKETLSLSTMYQSNPSKNHCSAGNQCQSIAAICIINTLNQRWRVHY